MSPPPALLLHMPEVWTYSSGFQRKSGVFQMIEDCIDNVQDQCCYRGGQHRVTYNGCDDRKGAVVMLCKGSK